MLTTMSDADEGGYNNQSAVSVSDNGALVEL